MSITTLFFSCAPTHRVVHMHTMPDLNPVEQHVLVHLTCPDSPQRCPGPDLGGDPVPCLIRSVPHVVRRPYRHIRSILLHQFITLVFGVSLNLAYCSFFPHLYQMWHPFVINTLSIEQHQDLHQWGVHGGSWVGIHHLACSACVYYPCLHGVSLGKPASSKHMHLVGLG